MAQHVTCNNALITHAMPPERDEYLCIPSTCLYTSEDGLQMTPDDFPRAWRQLAIGGNQERQKVAAARSESDTLPERSIQVRIGSLDEVRHGLIDGRWTLPGSQMDV
jgi:hypothetical protein